MKKPKMFWRSAGVYPPKQLLLAMKFTVLFTLVLTMSSFGGVRSQVISYSGKNVKMSDFFRAIKNQANYDVVSKSSDINNILLNVDFKEEALIKVLNDLLPKYGLEYTMENKAIIIKRRNDKPKGSTTYHNNEKYLAMGNQQELLKGRVQDASSKPIAGVTVSIKGKQSVQQTSSDGTFSINAEIGDELLFRFVGYQSVNKLVKNVALMSVTLQEDLFNVDDVVVTAYGKVKRGSLTDAVQTIGGEVLENRPIKSVTEGLRGIAPGINIKMPSGSPEGNPTINIRGFTSINSSASPLILVDGVERPIQDVNPNDVESISLLKDGASSAVYGSRAPYGVLLITTKSGKAGATTVNYSGTMKIGKMVMKPTQPESPEWAHYINLAAKNGRPDGTGVDEIDAITIARMKAWLRKDWGNAAFDELRERFGDQAQVYIENGQFPSGDMAYKNWTREQSFATTKLFEEYLKNTEISSQHNLSLNGGTDKLKYFSSLGYTDTDGLFRGGFNYNKRYNFKTRLDYKVNDWLELRTDINYVRQENQGANYRANSATDAASGNSIANYGDIFGSMNQYFSTPLRVPSGNAYSWILGAAGILGEGGLIKNQRDETVITGGATIKPIKYFEINGDYTWRSSNTAYSKVDKIVYTELPDGTKIQNNRSANVNSIAKTRGVQNYQFAKINAQYQRTFSNKHNVFAQVGMQAEDNRFESLTGSKTDLFDQDVIEALSAAANNPDTRDRMYQWTTLGFYGVATYDYDQRYMIKFTGRRDASSRFAADSRWGFFPSVSGAWNAGRENFWPLKEWVSEFKIRGSWSNSGDLSSVGASNYYTYLPTLDVGLNKTTLLGGNYVIAGYPPGLVSSSLTWAKPRVLDFGVDVTALNNRLTLTYDWYQRTIVDQMGPANPLPKVLGTAAPQLNNSESETRGWELSIGWNDSFNLATKPLRYDVKFHLSDYIGYVTKYNANATGARGGTWTPGQLFGENFVYKSGGVAQNTADLDGRTLTGTYNYPGYLQYQDLNGDGYINAGDGGFWYSRGDQVTNGFNYPRKSFAINTSFSWNNISFSAILEGVMKWNVYNSSDWVWGTSAGSGGTAYFYTPAFKESTKLGYWNPDNTGAHFPAFNTGRGLATDQYSLNLAHLRVRNITIGYDLPAGWLERIKLKRANLYFSGENLGFIYYKSAMKYDPDFLQSGMPGLFGSNANSYPPLRYYSFGVNLTL
ncbi:SusC/RagA family TonB-linked outer membrane protein [Sphingobacterium sp. UT-1RO-CII-1]|uniref:SusC/RagA family TonB-linked outer membrane protein n=1 Tax=Sphingobacterium sp. UT-1RO-CII-1 TaxID=2995225 RepID=UPI00227A6531|nr:SusC/RagA family TonB-linked outer membrane protein [Sphingobacterium sp. UT-1RO-CII-1]MCY4778106.1 SusC/RagA family TonB-linked outer membrane protein [Sphingobacterium sp. UT-1RO-CII-1]